MDQDKDGPAPTSIEQLQRFSKERVAEVFGVPHHLLVEPGHVMSREKYQELLEQQK